MMDYILAGTTALLLISGALFALSAAIGLVRLPDLYTRMHAASKVGTVGSGLLLLAAGLYSQELSILARAIAGFVFLLLTAPVSAHLLARAAHLSGYALGAVSVRDDMRKR
ncbi:monovalent cation/H(+) antiporter subunit G [Rhizobium redzepovicii]|jgi:multicomponent Na+:H+ antiporter subunit G|uniref:Monovalent cation/H(+) antiporter subunit G n=1 Tax=Rhizobium redzepovicii TaxID=2867518 RepID=A0AAW8NTV3_9HYPH|nr:MULTISPECIES: monovalent cation/H(+) antiporter subunit G [Rhizobium]MBB3520744.1 multicomponent Na+:H+ antiporter subunit G [Rhizobium sp. BK456]MBY4591538.1 monovalent cation/H(+) antiporter subunit G [Rhizobium redzepovicii]MBY4613384.1 monovalent cation/H(+) antiporter subunit G [Rhizobium redzepovicii]MDF0657776.1 monovalent cation/H(+) antiporter subunit G [Rhizobium sp. BC49]MDR9758081.1 monovalent cation/H(+) antiporter subunit G [Rhizobium redzepovicii]